MHGPARAAHYPISLCRDVTHRSDKIADSDGVGTPSRRPRRCAEMVLSISDHLREELRIPKHVHLFRCMLSTSMRRRSRARDVSARESSGQGGAGRLDVGGRSSNLARDPWSEEEDGVPEEIV